MPTYSQIRTQIFTALDLDLNTTGDTLVAVNEAIKQVVDELAYDVKPLELMTSAGPVNVTSATTSIALGSGGFNVTDMTMPYALGVDYKSTTTPVILLWDEMSYESYLQSNTARTGDVRGDGNWIYTPSSTFILTTWPQGSDTWDIYLYYYKQPAAIADSGVPEFPVLHHRCIALGAICLFPHYFGGDRAELFVKYENEFRKAKDRLLTARRGSRAALRLFPAGSVRPYTGINWNGNTGSYN